MAQTASISKCECWKNTTTNDRVVPRRLEVYDTQCIHPNPLREIPGINCQSRIRFSPERDDTGNLVSFWPKLDQLDQTANERVRSLRDEAKRTGISFSGGLHPIVCHAVTILQDVWCAEIFRAHLASEVHTCDELRDWCGGMQWVLQALYISFGDDPQGPLVIPGDAIAKSEKKKHKLQEDLILDRAYVVRLASPLMFGVDFDADAWLRATERIKEADADRVAYRASEDVSKKLPVWSKRAVKWAWSRMRELSGEDRPKERRTPSTTAEARGRLDEVVAWCEKMMQKSKPHGASGGTIFTNTEQSGLENRWPKSTGWDFVPGKVAFNGKELEIKGIKWKLLQRLATAHVAVTADELKVAGWGEENQADNNGLRYQLCELRKMLRHALGLGKADDPIPKVDRGNLGAWQLSENLRKT